MKRQCEQSIGCPIIRSVRLTRQDASQHLIAPVEGKTLTGVVIFTIGSFAPVASLKVILPAAVGSSPHSRISRGKISTNRCPSRAGRDDMAPNRQPDEVRNEQVNYHDSRNLCSRSGGSLVCVKPTNQASRQNNASGRNCGRLSA